MSTLKMRPSAAALSMLLACGFAKGQAHEAMVLVNPNSSESLHVSNYYAAARGVPASGLSYFDPLPTNFSDFVASRAPALLGSIANARNEDSIDYVILTPDTSFRFAAPGLVSDGCSPVSQFSTTGAYTMTRYVSAVQGGTNSLLSNGYFDVDGVARGFDNAISYTNGDPGIGATAAKPYIGCALGYTGERGNSRGELLSMIDRSVSADGTFPAGTFRFLQTNDVNRSSPRHGLYTAAVNKITAAGGSALRTTGQNLPSGGEVVLGAMSGFAADDIVGANFTFAPGAFADHLTSFAATFGEGGQTKLSRWIAKGAVGSFGTIEEPCNYPNKFPTAYLHVMYHDGLTLGEACLRSLQAVPFQGMMYGDPLCRPFTHVPVVNPGTVPSSAVSGNFTLTPSATTTHPSASIATFEVYVDGVLRAKEAAGSPLLIRTTNYPDGWHELRIVAIDSTLVGAQGEWVGNLFTFNHGKAVSATAPVSSTDRSGVIQLSVSANDADIIETRLLHNDRVVATSPSLGSIQTRGEIVGPGPARVRAEVLFADGQIARTQPFTVNISDANPPAGAGGPTAFGFHKTVKPGKAYILELPALHSTVLTEPTFTITSGPSQGAILGGSGRFRIIQANPGAAGTDQVGFSVTSNGMTSNAVATINFFDPDAQPCPADTNGDGFLDAQDFSFWIFAYNIGLVSIADLNGNGTLEPGDFTAWISAFNAGCDF